MKQFFFIITGVIILLEFYVYQAVKNIVSNHYMRWIYIVVNIVIYALFFYHILASGQNDRNHKHFQWFITLFLAFMLPKIVASLFLLIDDIFRFLQLGMQYATKAEPHFPERRKFLSLMGLGIAGTLSALFLDGVIFGKYRHKVRHVKLKIKNLPQSFKGYKIVQISDVHSGSFFNPEKLKPAFDLINEQKPDLILFTGDMVNNLAEEFQPLQYLFTSLKAKDGKFSVLG
ncbi:MAG: metallophosphoesterase, partial [Cruoricaptor ignavus]|nr:metallophosphoesterase [Cruoricaptor ignavus]